MEFSSAPVNVNQHSPDNRLWDWRAMLLAIVLVETSSARVVSTEWAPFLYFTQTMGFVGIILGLALGISNFSRQTVIRLSAGYTLIFLPAQLLATINRTNWLSQDLATLFNRLFISFGQFIKNQPVDDYLFFVSIFTLLYWGIGLFTGYWLSRHKDFLGTVLPSGLAILTVQAFDGAQSKQVWELALFIFASLLLLGRMFFLQNNSFWRKKNFLITDEAINDLERGALIFTAIMVFIAWSLPGWISNISPAAQAWQDFSQPFFDKFSNVVSALDSPYAVKNTSGDFYSGQLALGQQAATGNIPIFTVKVKESEFVPIRNYWKGRVYDLYLDGHWATVSNSSKKFNPESNELMVEYPDARHKMEFTFTNRTKKQTLLYTPAETVWVSKKAEIFSTPISEEVKDITAWISTTNLLNGGQYKVRALLTDPTIKELRSTGTEYPAWITDRYLQVPEDIAPQLRELTTEITAPYDTVYDKVQAVTNYLRKEIEYETKIASTPPKNKDPVLWVLFEYKKGFCMYYASAETLMLRSIGIPARMAVGFVEGDYDESEEQYVVTYKDSHAWSEVYFPGIGWVEFEPTSNQIPIERPETKNGVNNETRPGPNVPTDLEANPLDPRPLQEPPELFPNEETDRSSVTYRKNLYKNILIATVTALLTLGFSIFIIRRYSLNDLLPVYLANEYKRHGNVSPHWLNRWVRWATLSPIERAFQAINLSLSWLDHPQPAHLTSQERAEVLIKQLPSAQDQILSLLQEYQTTIYTLHAGNISAARRAAAIILLKTWQKKALKFADTRYNQKK